MATAYCTAEDVYARITSAAFVHPRAKVEAVSVSAKTLLIRGHGLPLDYPVAAASDPSASLPGPLTDQPLYYALPVTDDLVQLAATPGGAAIVLTDVGAGVFGLVRQHGPDLAKAILSASVLGDSNARGNRAPIDADVFLDYVARLAAKLFAAGHPRPSRWKEHFEANNAILEQEYGPLVKSWREGAPLPLGTVDATPGVADNGARLVKLQSRGDFDLGGCDGSNTA